MNNLLATFTGNIFSFVETARRESFDMQAA